MLRCFDGGDVAREVGEGWPQLFARFSEDPPTVKVSASVGRSRLFVLRLPDRFHRLQYVLVDLRIPLPHFVSFEPEQINHHHAARGRHEIAAVAIGADVTLKPGAFAEAQMLSFLRRDDEASTVQLHTR
jgi:hypothetical protein